MTSEKTSSEIDVGSLAPGAELHHTPRSVDEMADLYRELHASDTTTMVIGAGNHMGIGNPVFPVATVSSAGLDRVIDHQPEDLTLTVEAGTTLGAIESLLAPYRQSAVLPESPPSATIGGVVAAGLSGFRRYRFGPTRDRILEVTVVTGDGRVVTGGARVVKNVSGYDLPRLVTGAFGALGVVVSVCLKLWPEPEASATLELSEIGDATVLHRPVAVLETRQGIRAFVQGPASEVVSAARVGQIVTDSFEWPTLDHPGTAEMRVPPSAGSDSIRLIPSGVEFVAQHGVGVVSVATEDASVLVTLREWCESNDGTLVVTAHSGPVDQIRDFDPWGTPPAAISLQRRLIAGFDPRRIINRGRLPGGI